MEILKKKKKLSLILLFAVLILSAVGVYVVGASVRNNNAEPVEPEIVEEDILDEDILDEDILEDDEIEDEITEDDLAEVNPSQPPQDEYSLELQRVWTENRALSTEIIALTKLQTLSDCKVKYTNSAMAKFSFEYDQCIWRVTTALPSSEERTGVASFHINFEHKSTAEKISIRFFIPDAIGWGGPYSCVAHGDMQQLTDKLSRWTQVPSEYYPNGQTRYTESIVHKSMPHYAELVNSNMATFIYSYDDRRAINPSEANWCIISAPDLDTDNTLNASIRARYPSSFIDNRFLASMYTEVTNPAVLNDFDNVIRTLKF